MSNIKIHRPKKLLFFTALIFIGCCCLSFRNHKTVRQNAYPFHSITFDTSFILNSAEWDTLSTYFSLDSDSVEFEVILKRAVDSNTNWLLFSQFGTIDTAYRPINDQLVIANEPNREWSVSILFDGTCFIKLNSGPCPQGDTVILPLKMKYKK